MPELKYTVTSDDTTNKFDAGQANNLLIMIKNEPLKNEDPKNIYIKSLIIDLPLGKKNTDLFEKLDQLKITFQYDGTSEWSRHIKEENKIIITSNSTTSVLPSGKDFKLKIPIDKINDEIGVCKIKIEAETQEVDKEYDSTKKTDPETNNFYCIKYYKAPRDITEWKVETHHINVDPGDSTLITVYKIEKNVSTALDENKPLPTIKIINNSITETLEKALLIDFGKPTLKGISRVIPYITKKLTLPDGTYKPLDALVVTHYDDDHVGGFIAKKGNNIVDTLAAATTDCSIVKLFKKNDEYTYLYDCGNVKDVHVKCTYPSRLFKFNIPEPGDEPDPKNEIKIEIKRLTGDIKDEKSGNVIEKDRGRKLLGFELFWGTKARFDDNNPITQGDLQYLRGEMDPKDQDKPALFCVAVNESCIKYKSTIMPEIVPGSVTPKNSYSIALVLVSPSNQILHYFGGDLGPSELTKGLDPELNIANWVEAHGYTFDNKDKYIPAMKLSHHGAQASTPQKLLQVFRPKYAIASSGSEFLHPDFTLILYMYIFNKYNTPAGNFKYAMKMQATNAPYYMNPEDSKIRDVKDRLKAENNGGDGESNYQYLLDCCFKDNKIFSIPDNDKINNDFLNKKILTLDQKKLLKKVLEVWDECCNDPQIGILVNEPLKVVKDYFPQSGNYPKVESVIVKFNISYSGKVEIDKVEGGEYKEHEKALEATGVVSKPKKRKKAPRRRVKPKKKSSTNNIVNLLSLNENLLLTNTNFLTIASSIAQEGDIFLKENCEFDQFVRLLPEGKLILTQIDKKVVDNQLIITGLINNALADWFNEFAINNIKLTLTSVKDSKEKQDISRSVVTFSAEVNQNPFKLSEPIQFKGIIEADNTLVFKLLSNNVVTHMFDNAQFVGYGDDDFQQDLLAEILINLFKDLILPLDNSTQIVYDPLNNSTIQLDWVSIIKDTKGNFLSDKLSLNNLKIGFTSYNNAINEDWVSKDTGLYFNASLTIDQKFKSDISATIYSDGSGAFAFVPQSNLNENPKEILQHLCKILIPNFKSIGLLDKLPVNFNLVKQVNVNFDLSSKFQKITSVQFISSISLNDIKKLNVEFDVYITLPSTFVIAQLVVNDTDNEKLMRLSSLFDNYGVTAPDVSSNKNIGTFTLANVYFTADPQSSSYNLYADLVNAQDSIWTINIGSQAINLTEIGLTLSKNSKDLSASLWSKMKLGDSKIDLEGLYSKNSNKAEWQFSADISFISLDDIIYLFESSSTSAPKLPSFELSDVQLNLTCMNKNFNFDFKGNCIIDAATFSISASSTDKKINATWDGKPNVGFNLNSLIKTLAIDLPVPDLDINFTEASFSYDIVKKLIIFELKINDLSAYLYIFPYQNKYETLFCIDYRLSDNHSVHLPVVGNVQFPVEGFQLLLATADVDLSKISIDDSNLSLPKSVINKGAHLYVLIDKSLSAKPIELSVPVEAPRNNRVALHESFTATSSATAITKWINVQKSFGAINFKRIGISYQNSKLWFLLDAMLMTGIISINLEGLAVGFPLLNFKTPEFKLNGLGFDFNADALAISGNLIKDNTQEEDTYSGTISVRTPGFSLAGLGSYTHLPAGSVSLFLFIRSFEPFGGPPYFYIKGFAGGFGYNQQLRIPLQDEVINFPLISGVDDPSKLGGNSDNLITIQNSLYNQGKQWLIPTKENNWLAVGCDFTSFELINGKSLLIAEFGNEFQLALIGSAQIRLPKAGYPLAYADMGLEASLKPAEGLLAISAILNPSSYVLDPACHLTGGFAFYNWFTGDHAGDFVVTFGGYHPSFNKPSHYPDVPRLGFNWHVSDTVSINGDAYFALTPSCVMGGGALNASFHDGDLRAWFTAYANLLMQWQPFHYDVSVGVNVGASYKLNLLFTSTTLKVELGADVQLQGPPLYGTAHVHWGIISFTVNFGENPQNAVEVKWNDFKQFLPQRNSKSSLITLAEGITHLDATSKVSDLCKIIINSSYSHQKNENACLIRADNFSFHTESAMPLTHIIFNNVPVNDKNGKAAPADAVNIKPMGQSNIESIHTVEIKYLPNNKYNPQWQLEVVQSNVPEALWGSPSSNAADKNSVQPTANTLPNRWVGLNVKAPSSIAGYSPGSINLQNAFGYVPIKTGLLPYGDKAAGNASIQNDTQSIAIIQQTITDKSVAARRDSTVNYLMKLGLFPTQKIDSLNRFQAQIGNLFSEPPLQAKATNTI